MSPKAETKNHEYYMRKRFNTLQERDMPPRPDGVGSEGLNFFFVPGSVSFTTFFFVAFFSVCK